MHYTVFTVLLRSQITPHIGAVPFSRHASTARPLVECSPSEVVRVSSDVVTVEPSPDVVMVDESSPGVVCSPPLSVGTVNNVNGSSVAIDP